MKQTIVFFIIINILIWGNFNFGFAATNSNGNNTRIINQTRQNISATSGKIYTIYEQRVGNLTNAQTDKLWPSNNPRSWILTGTMDGEIVKKYKAWSNQYKSLLAKAEDKRGLEDNTDLTVYIKDLNINTSDYQDIRLIIDYLNSNSNTSLTHIYSMELFAIDDKHNKYGPFNIADFEPTGFYQRRLSNGEVYERNFNIISENIKVPSSTTITTLEIKPYANYPRIRNDGKTITGNWRGADAAMFSVGGMKVVGYKNNSYQRPEYVKFKVIDVNKTREDIVKRMYDIATIKWIPSIEFHDTRVVGIDPKKVNSTYKTDTVYYGLPYTQRNRVTPECFVSHVHNDNLDKPANLLNIWGADCASSVTYAISKFIPMHVIYNTTDFLWDRNKTTILGNLQIDGKAASSESIKEKYNCQEIWEAFAKLQKGDIISTHNRNGTHVRLISGDTHVERNSDGKIDPINSYFFRTDIHSTLKDVININDYGGLVNKEDYVVPFEPKKIFTDITKLSDLKDKNLTFYINKKTSFQEAYDSNYVPITLNAYLTSTTEVPYARIVNANTAENLKNGLKGTIFSNYTILSITFTLKNKKTSEEKLFIDYPNHNTGSLEGMYGNAYSLYYHTPENIKNYIRETFEKTKDFKLTISVSAGESGNIKVLSLN